MANPKVDPIILNLLGNIGLQSQVKRNDYCIALVQYLAGKNDSTDVEFCLKRLMRGLGATQQSITEGYFTTLVSVLDTFSTSVTSADFLKLVSKEFGKSKDASKEFTFPQKEHGDPPVGKVLAYGAAMRGGLFSRSSNDDQELMLSTLVQCGKSKSHTPAVVSSFVCDLIQNCDQSVLVEVVWPVLLKCVKDPSKGHPLNTLLYLITLIKKAPEYANESAVQKLIGSPIFSVKSMAYFAQKLVAESSAESLDHPIYEEFSRGLCAIDKKSLLKTFWNEHVAALLTERDRARDLAAIRVFTALLKEESAKRVELLVTPTFMRVLGQALSLSHKSKKTRLTYQMATDAVNTLQNILTSDDIPEKVVFEVLSKLASDSQWQHLAGVVLLYGNLSREHLDKFAQQFKNIIGSVSATSTNHRTAVQLLVRLISNPACKDDVDWKVKQLTFLLDCGIFNNKSSSSISISLAHFMRDSFFSSLDQSSLKIETMVSILSQIVEHVDNRLSSGKGVLRTPFTTEASSSWKKMTKQVRSIEQKNGNRKSGNNMGNEQIFRFLLLSMGLQLLSNPELAISALEELNSCYEHMKPSKRSSNTLNEPEWIEVTIDLFLSLLSHDSHLLRSIVCKVFPHLGKHLTVSAFCQILEVLDPNQNPDPLTSAKDLDGANDSESESDFEEDTDSVNQRVANGKQGNNRQGEEGSGEDNDEDSADDNDEEFEDIDDEIETPNDRLRMEVRLALGNAASLTDTESVDLDDIDEEEGNRVDAALAAAFRTLNQSKGKKKNKKEKKEVPLTHFRSRVLDLVDIYISKEPSMAICHECIAPLISLLDFCMKDVHLKNVENKTRSILKKLTTQKKFSSMDEVSEESIAMQIEALAVRGVGDATTFLRLSKVISDCCTFFVRCSELLRVHSSKPESSLEGSPVVRVHKTLLLDFFTKRKTLLTIEMFKSLLNLRWGGWWYLAPTLVQCVFDSKVIRTRRVKAVDLLTHFFKIQPHLNTSEKLLKKIVATFMKHTSQMLESPEIDSHLIQYIPIVLNLVHRILTNPATKPADMSPLSTSLTSFAQRCDAMNNSTKAVFMKLFMALNLDVRILHTKKNLKKVKNNLPSTRDDEEHDDDDDESEGDGDDLSNMNGSVDAAKQNGKQSVRNQKGKKDKKLQRLACMGEGLDSLTFSDINSEVMNGLEPDEEEFETNSEEPEHFVNSTAISHSKRKPQQPSAGDARISKKKKKVK